MAMFEPYLILSKREVSEDHYLACLVNFYDFVSSVDFFQNHLFRKILSVSNTLDPD